MPRMLDESPHLQSLLRDTEIVYTDLDGTLLGRGGTLLVDGTGSPSTVAADAVVKMNLAGIPVVPVTGRSRLQCTEIVRMCGWTDFICEAGSIRSYFDGKKRQNLFDTPEWSADTKLLVTDGTTPLELIRESGALTLLQEAFPGHIEHHEPWHHAREGTDVLRGYVDVRQAQSILNRLELPISIIDNGVIHPKVTTLRMSDEPIRAYHLVPRGVSKVRAIQLDLERRGISPSNAVMIGDGPSDLKTAELLGLTLLVENALKSPGLDVELAATPNAALVRGRQTEGWANFAHALLEAKGV